VYVYLNLCGQVLDATLWNVTTTKHGPQPIALDTMLIGPSCTYVSLCECVFVCAGEFGRAIWGQAQACSTVVQLLIIHATTSRLIEIAPQKPHYAGALSL